MDISKITHAQVMDAAVSWLYRPFQTLIATELTDKSWADYRLDVVAVDPNKHHIRIVECKASRSDFLAGRKNFEIYMTMCHQFYIAAPCGMIKLEELPKEIGLIEVGAGGWKRQKQWAVRRSMETRVYTNILERVIQKIAVERSLPPWDKRRAVYPPPHNADNCPRRHLDPL